MPCVWRDVKTKVFWLFSLLLRFEIPTRHNFKITFYILQIEIDENYSSCVSSSIYSIFIIKFRLTRLNLFFVFEYCFLSRKHCIIVMYQPLNKLWPMKIGLLIAGKCKCSAIPTIMIMFKGFITRWLLKGFGLGYWEMYLGDFVYNFKRVRRPAL